MSVMGIHDCVFEVFKVLKDETDQEELRWRQ